MIKDSNPCSCMMRGDRVLLYSYPQIESCVGATTGGLRYHFHPNSKPSAYSNQYYPLSYAHYPQKSQIKMKKLYPFLQFPKPLRFLYVSALYTANRGYVDNFYAHPLI